MRPGDETSDGRWLSREEYREIARGLRTSLFRLQVHPVYSVASEREEFERFLATGTYDIDPDDAALTRMRESTAAGKLSQRVYVVTRPLTDYQRYVFRYYHHMAEAGEDLRIIDTTDQEGPTLPDYDFMLVDDATVIKLHYEASDGGYIGPELLVNADPGVHLGYRRVAIAASVPFLDYEKTLGS